MSNQSPNNEFSRLADSADQLIRYQQKITNILESFTDAFFEVDKNWIVSYWNAEAERLLMKSRDEILGKNLWEVYHDAIPLKFYSEYHRAVRDNVSVQFQEYFEPKKLWLEVAAFPSGEGLSVYFKDITEAKHDKQVLEEERKKYHDLFNFSPLPQWVYDIDTLAFLQVNQAAIDHYGYSNEEFLNMTIKDIHLHDDVLEQKDIIKHEVKADSLVQHQKKHGEIIFVKIESNSVRFGEKKARLVMVIDLTDKLIAERKLQSSLNRYDIVSKATSDTIWDRDIKTGHVDWNRGIRGVFGHKHVKYHVDWWKEHIHPEDLPRVDSEFRMLISNQMSKHQVEYRFRCADGRYKTVLDRSFILFDDHGEAVRVIGSMQDITERIQNTKAIEAQDQQLREISWMQAHDLRAPLAKILGLSELINTEDTQSLDEIRKLASLIQVSAKELDQVVKGIIQKSQKER